MAQAACASASWHSSTVLTRCFASSLIWSDWSIRCSTDRQGAAPAYDFHSTHIYVDQVVREILLRGVEAGELRGENLEEALFMLLGMLDSMSCMLVMEPIRPPFSTQDIGRLIDLVFDGARGVLRPKEGNT